MNDAPNLVVAGHPGLSQKLRAARRFPVVFDVASATELRNLSRSGRVQPPAAFMFAPGFTEDLPDADVPHLANGLAASGFTVLVHNFFTARGDHFAPGVVATAAPMSLSQLLATLGAARPVSFTPPDLQPEPPPAFWAPPEMAPAEPDQFPARPQPTIIDEPLPGPVQIGAGDEQESPATPEIESTPTPIESAHSAPVYDPPGAYTPGPPLPLQEAVRIAASVGRGLQALHEQGLVHGDVHPGQILYDAEGPQLTGAGDLQDLASHSAPGVLEPVDLERIEPGFAAPEVLRVRSATAASDVYGLGATLWSLLAGHAPFTADDSRAVRGRALHEPVPRVPRDDVPEWLASVLAKAMAREPADRHPTARAFTDALEGGPRDVPEPPAAGWEFSPGWEWPAEDPVSEPVAQPVSEPSGIVRNQGPAPVRVPVTSGQRGRHRKPLAAALAVLVVVGAGVGAAALRARSRAAEQRTQATSSLSATPPSKSSRAQSPQAKPTRTPTPVQPMKKFTPGQVKIADARVSIKVTWQDQSGGKAAYYVVGGPTGHEPTTLASAPPGTEKVTVVALNPSVDYCLTVVAVVDVDRVAHAEPVCTHRVKRKG